MNAEDVMFVWTPDRHPFQNSLTAGHIAATTIPEASGLKSHPCSTGTCDLWWRDADPQTRRERLQALISQWIYKDNIPVSRVRIAVMKVEEYKDFPFSEDEQREEHVDEDDED